MPDTRSTCDASEYPNDMDSDLADEYNTIMDAAVAAKDKYTNLVAQARKMKSALAAKQVELEQATGRDRRSIIYFQNAADKLQTKFQAQSVKMQKLKRENEMLRRRNKQLLGNLETDRQKLRQMDRFKCEICPESVKNVVTRCGHGFCSDCLTTWLRPTGEADFWEHDLVIVELTTSPCPMCRTVVSEANDVWRLYLGADCNGQGIVQEDSEGE